MTTVPDPPSNAPLPRGLAGVEVDSTAVSSIDPENGILLYRGYPAPELAAHCSFEQVAYLLWYGTLPDAAQLTALENSERRQRTLPTPVAEAVLALPASAHPMDVLRTAVSVLGIHDHAVGDRTPKADLARSVRLLAQIPGIVALDQRRRHGLDPVEPREDLPWAASFLHQVTGLVPDDDLVHAFEVASILHAEHTFNASTFTARVVASTLSDLYSAVVAAVGALKGTLHGGANEAVMHALTEIGVPSQVGAWLDSTLGQRHRVMGFGHRIYRNGDARVPTMKVSLDRLVEVTGPSDLTAVHAELEAQVLERTGLHPNLNFSTALAFHLLGFDTPMLTPLFAASRVVGWTAHIQEQLAHNTLIRPSSVYTGEPLRHVPLP